MVLDRPLDLFCESFCSGLGVRPLGCVLNCVLKENNWFSMFLIKNLILLRKTNKKHGFPFENLHLHAEKRGFGPALWFFLRIFLLGPGSSAEASKEDSGGYLIYWNLIGTWSERRGRHPERILVNSLLEFGKNLVGNDEDSGGLLIIIWWENWSEKSTEASREDSVGFLLRVW